jgi:hypothetical protein
VWVGPYAGMPPGPATETVEFKMIGEAVLFGKTALTLKSPGARNSSVLPSPTMIVPVAKSGVAVGDAAGVIGFCSGCSWPPGSVDVPPVLFVHAASRR